jgi:hypothetical protein
VIKAASSLQRKRAAWAISSGWAMRPMGWAFEHFGFAAGVVLGDEAVDEGYGDAARPQGFAAHALSWAGPKTCRRWTHSGV